MDIKLFLWQILVEAVTLNAGPAVGADVCSSLGSPRYAVRHATEVALVKAWPLSAPTLQRAAAARDNHVALVAQRLIYQCRWRDLASAGQPPRADALAQVCWAQQLNAAIYQEPMEIMGEPPWTDLYWPADAERAASERVAFRALERGMPVLVIRYLFASGRAIEQRHGNYP